MHLFKDLIKPIIKDIAKILSSTTEQADQKKQWNLCLQYLQTTAPSVMIYRVGPIATRGSHIERDILQRHKQVSWDDLVLQQVSKNPMVYILGNVNEAELECRGYQSSHRNHLNVNRTARSISKRRTISTTNSSSNTSTNSISGTTFPPQHSQQSKSSSSSQSSSVSPTTRSRRNRKRSRADSQNTNDDAKRHKIDKPKRIKNQRVPSEDYYSHTASSSSARRHKKPLMKQSRPQRLSQSSTDRVDSSHHSHPKRESKHESHSMTTQRNSKRSRSEFENTNQINECQIRPNIKSQYPFTDDEYSDVAVSSRPLKRRRKGTRKVRHHNEHIERNAKSTNIKRINSSKSDTVNRECLWILVEASAKMNGTITFGVCTNSTLNPVNRLY